MCPRVRSGLAVGGGDFSGDFGDVDRGDVSLASARDAGDTARAGGDGGLGGDSGPAASNKRGGDMIL